MAPILVLDFHPIWIYILLYVFFKLDSTFYFFKVFRYIFILNVFAMNWRSFRIASKIMSISYPMNFILAYSF